MAVIVIMLAYLKGAEELEELVAVVCLTSDGVLAEVEVVELQGLLHHMIIIIIDTYYGLQLAVVGHIIASEFHGMQVLILREMLQLIS